MNEDYLFPELELDQPIRRKPINHFSGKLSQSFKKLNARNSVRSNVYSRRHYTTFYCKQPAQLDDYNNDVAGYIQSVSSINNNIQLNNCSNITLSGFYTNVHIYNCRNITYLNFSCENFYTNSSNKDTVPLNYRLKTAQTWSIEYIVKDGNLILPLLAPLAEIYLLNNYNVLRIMSGMGGLVYL